MILKDEENTMILHNIDPIYDSNSGVLILGSFPSPKSREQGFFYGHPRNRMWKVLASVFGEPFPETVDDRKSFLLRNRIAMWDVLSECEIKGASDVSIRSEKPNDLSRIFGAADIKAVFAAGSTAAKYYRKYDLGRYDVPFTALRSTSPANAAVSLEELIEEYRCIRFLQ